MKDYDHKKIESKWQKTWKQKGIYKAKDGKRGANGEAEPPKAYVLDMFPYPSGEGLHVGHPKGYIATDIYSRFKKMSGFNVLHPMGWDAFGLPAENYAIKNKTHPRIAVEKNIKRYKEQLSIIGFNYDWSREINTTDPKYYKWTQWIFLKMLEKGLAFQSFEPINWCPSCQTGLANEDLEDGKCERCGSVVEKRPMRQWVLKITDYAERLLADLAPLNWPESIKESQRNWIGKSEGVEISFPIEFEHGQKPGLIPVFTTRPETIFGATALIFSPEHLWVRLALDQDHKGVLNNADEVRAYVQKVTKKTEIERTNAQTEKTGIKLEGVWAVNPANKEKIPVFVADFVLANHGTGAIMAVPAHDERDFQFAKKYNVPIKEVLEPLFIKQGGQDEPHSGLPFVKRDAAVAVIRHWSEDKYLVLKWKKTDWKGFVIGGKDKDETFEQAAAREITEETGYRNPKFVKNLGGVVHAQFYHAVKNENRWAHFHPMLFQLENDERNEIAAEENAIHEVVWVDRAQVDKTLDWVTDMRLIWWRAMNLNTDTFPGKSGLHESSRVIEKAILTNSGKHSGRIADEVVKEILTEVGGQVVTKYKLRDWVFSRQRYWGEPIPVIHCEKCGVVPVPEKDLPVKLPNVKNYEPTGTGESPLATIEKWVNVKCPKCGDKKAKRETNTMPQWAGSCWYYLRFMDPKNAQKLVASEKEKYWSPVDVYVGGAEHATRHLIYARFWHKFLHDIGAVSTSEPFTRLHNVGLILAEDGRKMSKRFGNVINPDDVVSTYGADTFRIYEMFMGPFNQASAWDTKSIMGSRRFVERVWRIADAYQKQNSKSRNSKDGPQKDSTSQTGQAGQSRQLETLLHSTIAKVTNDIETFSFNTAISSLMILSKELEGAESISKETLSIFLRLVAPFAPHIADEAWTSAGLVKKSSQSIHLTEWPTFDPAKIVAESARIVVQINSKVRDEFNVPIGLADEEVQNKALSLENVKKWLKGAPIKRVIIVKNRLINIVTG